MSGTITIRINDKEDAILNDVAVVYGTSKSSLLKQLAFEKLEDEYDIQLVADYEKQKKNGKVKTMPIEELWKKMGL